jgi:hypothetical protein
MFPVFVFQGFLLSYAFLPEHLKGSQTLRSWIKLKKPQQRPKLEHLLVSFHCKLLQALIHTIVVAVNLLSISDELGRYFRSRRTRTTPLLNQDSRLIRVKVTIYYFYMYPAHLESRTPNLQLAIQTLFNPSNTSTADSQPKDPSTAISSLSMTKKIKGQKHKYNQHERSLVHPRIGRIQNYKLRCDQKSHQKKTKKFRKR